MKVTMNLFNNEIYNFYSKKQNFTCSEGETSRCAKDFRSIFISLANWWV